MTTPCAEDSPRRALLIGIDRYSFLDESCQLEGCVNDVQLARSTLIERGFRPEEVTLLTDGAASREAVIGEFEKLREFASCDRAGGGEGAFLFVHFSGHGSRVRSASKSAGWLESIVPADSGRGIHPNRDIPDHWIEAWLEKVTRETPRLVLVFDACRSGSLSRNVLGVRPRWVEADPRPIDFSGLSPAPAGGRGVSGWPVVGDRHVLVAACGAKEIAHEQGGGESSSPAYGALSFRFYANLRATPSGTTYRALFDRVRASVAADFPGQHPQLEGAREQLIFGTSVMRAEPHLVIDECSDKRVRLAGGAAHGVLLGAEWALYPTGTRRPYQSEPLARTRIVEVGATTSYAELIGEVKPDAVVAGCRAFEHRRPTSAYRLAVYVAEGNGVGAQRTAELVARIKAEPSLRRVPVAADAEVEVRELGCTERESEVGAALPEPATEPVWVMAARDGSVLGSPRPVARRESIDFVVENLVRRARYRQMIKLAEEQPLCLDVDLRLLAASSEENWAEARSGASGETLYRAGERLAFEISNLSDEPLFTYLFHLGAQGEVLMLDPVRGGHEALAPGRVRGLGKGRRVLTATASEPDSAMSGPTEYLVLFASTCELDLSIFLQPGYRGIDRTETEVWSAVVRGFRVEEEP